MCHLHGIENIRNLMEMILVFKQQELQLVKEIEFFLSLIGKRD
jgi:nitrate reductase NapAB chaperone NapD